MDKEFDNPNASGQSSSGNFAEEINQDQADALSTLIPIEADDVYMGWDNTTPIDAFETIAPTQDGFVYGLDAHKPAAHAAEAQPRKRIPVPLLVMMALLAVCVALGILVLVLGSPTRSTYIEQPAKQVQAVKMDVVGDQTVQTLSAGDIKSLVCGSLVYQGEDLSLSRKEASVVVHDGKVMVVHRLAENAEFKPPRIVRHAGIRANVLATLLTGQTVEDDKGNTSEFKELTWVLQNVKGDVYIGISELPGELRTSKEEYGVLKGSHGYVMSSSLYASLGSNPKIDATKGTNPTDPNGTLIEAYAEVPKNAIIAKEEQKTKPVEEKKSDTEAKEKKKSDNKEKETTPSEIVDDEPGDEGGSQDDTPADPGDAGDSGDTGDGGGGEDGGDEPDPGPGDGDDTGGDEQASEGGEQE